MEDEDLPPPPPPRPVVLLTPAMLDAQRPPPIATAGKGGGGGGKGRHVHTSPQQGVSKGGGGAGVGRSQGKASPAKPAGGKDAKFWSTVFTCAACGVESSGEESFVQHCQGAKHASNAGAGGFAGLVPNKGGVTPPVSDALLARCAGGGGGGKKGKASKGSGGGGAAAVVVPLNPLGCACKKCGFDKHQAPPPHFSTLDRAYCCSLCRMTSGKEHGGHCERRARTVDPKYAAALAAQKERAAEAAVRWERRTHLWHAVHAMNASHSPPLVVINSARSSPFPTLLSMLFFAAPRAQAIRAKEREEAAMLRVELSPALHAAVNAALERSAADDAAAEAAAAAQAAAAVDAATATAAAAAAAVARSEPHVGKGRRRGCGPEASAAVGEAAAAGSTKAVDDGGGGGDGGRLGEIFNQLGIPRAHLAVFAKKKIDASALLASTDADWKDMRLPKGVRMKLSKYVADPAVAAASVAGATGADPHAVAGKNGLLGCGLCGVPAVLVAAEHSLHVASARHQDKFAAVSLAASSAAALAAAPAAAAASAAASAATASLSPAAAPRAAQASAKGAAKKGLPVNSRAFALAGDSTAAAASAAAAAVGADDSGASSSGASSSGAPSPVAAGKDGTGGARRGHQAALDLNPPPPVRVSAKGGDPMGPMGAQRRGLPVWGFREALLAAIASNPVVVVEGETGSGKTTQVPQYVVEDAASKGVGCNVVVAQPRRISAMTVAERVAAERGEAIGGTVGYTIRLESKVSSATKLLFCTTGILLKRLEDDPLLSKVTHVFVDEVHERSIESDFLLMVLRDLLGRRTEPLKVVLMSATLDADLFHRYFAARGQPAPAVSFPGRTFPVVELYVVSETHSARAKPQPINQSTNQPMSSMVHGFSGASQLLRKTARCCVVTGTWSMRSRRPATACGKGRTGPASRARAARH